MVYSDHHSQHYHVLDPANVEINNNTSTEHEPETLYQSANHNQPAAFSSYYYEPVNANSYTPSESSSLQQLSAEQAEPSQPFGANFTAMQPDNECTYFTYQQPSLELADQSTTSMNANESVHIYQQTRAMQADSYLASGGVQLANYELQHQSGELVGSCHVQMMLEKGAKLEQDQQQQQVECKSALYEPYLALSSGQSKAHHDELSFARDDSDDSSAGSSSSSETSSASTLTRDERRAREANIPLSYYEIVNLSIDQFNEQLAKHNLSESQLTLIKDIRRRGKNKVAAQSCRKRKMEQIYELQFEVNNLISRRQTLCNEWQQLLKEHANLAQEYDRIYSIIQLCSPTNNNNNNINNIVQSGSS